MERTKWDSLDMKINPRIDFRVWRGMPGFSILQAKLHSDVSPASVWRIRRNESDENSAWQIPPGMLSAMWPAMPRTQDRIPRANVEASNMDVTWEERPFIGSGPRNGCGSARALLTIRVLFQHMADWRHWHSLICKTVWWECKCVKKVKLWVRENWGPFMARPQMNLFGFILTLFSKSPQIPVFHSLSEFYFGFQSTAECHQLWASWPMFFPELSIFFFFFSFPPPLHPLFFPSWLPACLPSPCSLIHI